MAIPLISLAAVDASPKTAIIDRAPGDSFGFDANRNHRLRGSPPPQAAGRNSAVLVASLAGGNPVPLGIRDWSHLPQ